MYLPKTDSAVVPEETTSSRFESTVVGLGVMGDDAE